MPETSCGSGRKSFARASGTISIQYKLRPQRCSQQAATSTLLALVIGFTFSMAVTRYDQRKTLEETEANATGTEYFARASLTG
jgi:hypothetical protein